MELAYEQAQFTSYPSVAAVFQEAPASRRHVNVLVLDRLETVARAYRSYFQV